MAKKVVIIESAGKIASYKKALGSDYIIQASQGHCVDLPAKGLSIDLKNDFEPTFAVSPDKGQIVDVLRKLAKNADTVYLMSDEDREGEAIAWHLKNILQPVSSAKFYRASTNEVTKAGIIKALKNPGDINMNMIDAYLCRRLLDRLCGYKTSFLTKQATGGRSAGRVQSAMLRVIADREKEILTFIPQEYWILTATFKADTGHYHGTLDDKIEVPNEKKAVEIYQHVTKSSPTVFSVEQKEATITPYAPFTTSTLIQTASSGFGWKASRVMKVAQKLYEGGHITYMRTDSPSMASEAIDAIRAFVLHSHDNSYLHSTVRKYSAKKGAQEGHECCRPTEVQVQHAGANVDEHRMYELIWRRAVASQMSNGRDKRIKVNTKTGDYVFISRGNVRLFDGFRKVWNYTKHEDTLLPDLQKGSSVTLLDLQKEQKWTSPPPRYSDASLQKKCDTLQITRPATYASFLDTLENRSYITREKKSFKATDLGLRVIEFLVQSGMCFVDLKFTAEMENSLDNVASGTGSRSQVLSDFWETLQHNIQDAKAVKDKLQLTDFDCPSCDGKLRLKHSQYGPFFSCEHYSKKEDTGCKFTAKVGGHGEPIEKVIKVKEYASFACERCGSKMVKRVSKYGSFWGCDGYPNCKSIADMDGAFKVPSIGKKFSKKKFAKKKTPKVKKAKKTKKKSVKKKKVAK